MRMTVALCFVLAMATGAGAAELCVTVTPEALVHVNAAKSHYEAKREVTLTNEEFLRAVLRAWVVTTLRAKADEEMNTTMETELPE